MKTALHSGAVLLATVAPAAIAQAPPAPARVAIAANDSGAARVDERFPLDGVARPRTLRILRQPCAELSAVRVAVDGVVVPTVTAVRGPWLDVTIDSATSLATAASLSVSYRVALRARTAGIPLVVPDVSLGTTAAATWAPAKVLIELTLPAGAAAHPVLPQLARAAPGHWTARLVALPSVVRVDRGGNAAPAKCGEARASGPAGGFDRRFGLFLMTLALWVPLYFWWALRQDRTA